MQHNPNLSTSLFSDLLPQQPKGDWWTPVIIRFRESNNSMSMSCESTGKSCGDCLKLAKQWYSIWVKLCYFWTTAFSQAVQKHQLGVVGNYSICYSFSVRTACCIFKRGLLKFEWFWKRRKLSHFLTPFKKEGTGGHDLYTNCWSFTYDRTSEIHLMNFLTLSQKYVTVAGDIILRKCFCWLCTLILVAASQQTQP